MRYCSGIKVINSFECWGIIKQRITQHTRLIKCPQGSNTQPGNVGQKEVYSCIIILQVKDEPCRDGTNITGK